MRYLVQFEDRYVRDDVIEADSLGEAVREAKRREVETAARMLPVATYAQPFVNGEPPEELTCEVVGLCDRCGIGIVDDNPEGTADEWQWTMVGNEHDPDLICRACHDLEEVEP